MDSTTERFVDYAHGLKYADLTPKAIHAAKRSLVDSVGCALGAFKEAPIQALHHLAAGISARKPATVFGTATRTSPEMAAFVNGSMVRYLDFSDDYFGGHGDTGPHPSDNTGGVMAAVEAVGGEGKDYVFGIVLAYEVCGQLVNHITLRAKGWDHPIMHAVATSVAAGRVMGLSHGQLGNALSLAIVPNITLLQTRYGELSNWKSFAGPNGSRNGLFAAQLAGAGITGPPEAFEGKAGFAKQLNNQFEPGPFGGSGVPFIIEKTYHKYFPLRYAMQLPVWMALEMRDKLKIDDIQSIRIYVEGRSVDSRDHFPQFWDPHTRETADHSEPYLVGAALVDGEITEKTFTPERFRDPTILALIQKIDFVEDKAYSAAYPATFNCRYEVTLKSGQKVVTHRVNPKGHPTNPMTDAELETKFLKQVAGVLAPARSRALLDCLWEVEKLDSLGKMFELMRVG